MKRLSNWRADPPHFDRSSTILLGSSFVSSLGVFLVAPYLASHLVRNGSVSVQAAGVYLGLMYWCLTAGSLSTGFLSERFGIKPVMTAGLLLRFPGYLLFLLPDSPVMLALACVTTGFGGALYFPSSKTALMLLTPESKRLQALSVRNMCANSGVALGPVLGIGVLALSSPAVLLTLAALVFAVLAMLNSTIRLTRSPRGERVPVLTDLTSALRITGVPALCFTSFAFGTVYIHFESTIPLQLTEVGQARLIIFVFLINSVVVVCTQFLGAMLISRSRVWMSTMIGFAFYAAGFALFGLPVRWSFAWLMGVVLFSFGEVLVGLLLDYETVRLAQDRSTTVFGLGNFVNAGGGAVGGWMGALLITSAGEGRQPFTWTILAVASIVLGAASTLLLSTAERPQRSITVERKGILR